MGPIVPLSIRPSFIRFMFYDECALRVTFMGNAVWPLSAFNPFRSLFLLAFFLFLSISSPILQTFRNVDFDIRYFLFILVTFLFFFFYPFCVQLLLPATPEGIVVNGEGSVLQWLLRVAPRRRTVIEKLAGGFKPLDTLLREFD